MHFLQLFRVITACSLVAVSIPACAHPPRFTPANGSAPFSKAVQVGDVLYLSGQIGNRPDNTLPADVSEQAQQVMDNISAVVAEHGGTMDDVFKCTVMLADIADWQAFNVVYAKYFKSDTLPARSAFATNGLVAGALFEVECLAYRKGHE